MTRLDEAMPDFTIDIDEDAVVAGVVVTLYIGLPAFTYALTSADIPASAISCELAPACWIGRELMYRSR